MEKQKEFRSIAKALDFCMERGIRHFYFTKGKVGKSILHWFECDCFECDICHEITPKEYEGAEPNVCANCYPEIFEGEIR